MRLKTRDKYINIEESVIITVFVSLLSVKAREYLNSYFMCYLFIVFHEATHIFIGSLLGYNFKCINIKIVGLNANFNETFNGVKGIIIYLVGPLSNLILSILFKDIEIVYDINRALALLNLLPIKPLDGFNVVKLILMEWMNEKQVKEVTQLIQKLTEILLLIISIIMFVKNTNFSLFLLLVYIKINSLNPLKSL